MVTPFFAREYHYRSMRTQEQDSLRGSSVKIGTIQRRLAWPLRKDDTHKSRSVYLYGDPGAAAGAPAAARLPAPRGLDGGGSFY